MKKSMAKHMIAYAGGIFACSLQMMGCYPFAPAYFAAAVLEEINSVWLTACMYIAMLYFMLFFFGGITISVCEGLPLLTCLYEAASAVGTVGLTLGITPDLHIISKLVLIVLMYLGRVGGLTLIYAVFSGRNTSNAKLPLEKITVG